MLAQFLAVVILVASEVVLSIVLTTVFVVYAVVSQVIVSVVVATAYILLFQTILIYYSASL